MDKHDAVRNLLTQVHLAAVLLTRLPLPRLDDDAFADTRNAVWAYPVVGLGIGLTAALVGWIAMALGLPMMLVAGLCLAAMMIATGAMHEDGLADTCDGFWGAQSRERRLEIMRDSQIGSYGVLALGMVTGLRWGAFTVLLPIGVGPMIAAAILSRAMMPALMTALPHARHDGLSRSVGTPDPGAVMIGLGGGAVLALFMIGWSVILCLAIAGLMALAVSTIARAKIKGQTGDVLGATQQLSETAILLVCVALWT